MTITTLFQDKVLHNIMSIFTFMGANVMRLDDAYSFQVISKTVRMVIPALIQVSCLHASIVVSISNLYNFYVNASLEALGFLFVQNFTVVNPANGLTN